MVSRPVSPPPIEGLPEQEPPGIGDMLKEGGVGGFAQAMLPGLISGRSPAIESARRAAQQPGGPNKLFSAMQYAPQAAGEGANYLREYSGAADVRDIFSAIQGKDIEYGTELGMAERIMYATPFIGVVGGVAVGAIGYAAYRGARARGYTQPGGLEALRTDFSSESGQLQLDAWSIGDSRAIRPMPNTTRPKVSRSRHKVGDRDPERLTAQEDIANQMAGTTRGPQDEIMGDPRAGSVDYDVSQTIDPNNLDEVRNVDLPESVTVRGEAPDQDVLNVPLMWLSGDNYAHVSWAESFDEVADGMRSPKQTLGRVKPLDEVAQGNLVAGLTAWANKIASNTSTVWGRVEGIDGQERSLAAARFEAQRMAAFVEGDLISGSRGDEFVTMWDDFINGRVDVGTEEFDQLLGNLDEMSRLLDSFGMTAVEGSLGPNMRHAGIHINDTGEAFYLLSHDRTIKKPTKVTVEGRSRTWMLADGRGNTITVDGPDKLPAQHDGFTYLIGEGMYPQNNEIASYEGLMTQNLLKTLLVAFADKETPKSVKEFQTMGYEFYASYAQMLSDMYGTDFSRSLDTLAAETPQAHMERDSIPGMTEQMLGTSRVTQVADETGNMVTRQNRTELGSAIEGAVNGQAVRGLAQTMEAENARLGRPAPSGQELMGGVLENVRGVLGSRDWTGAQPPETRFGADGQPLQYLQGQKERLQVDAVSSGQPAARTPGEFDAALDKGLQTLRKPGDEMALPAEGAGVFGKGETKVKFKVTKDGNIDVVGLARHTGEKLRTMTMLPKSLNPEVFENVLNAIVADTHYFANVMGYRSGLVPHFDNATAYAAVVRAAVNVAKSNPELFDHLGKVQSGAWYPWRNMGGVAGSPSGLIVWDNILRRVQGHIDSPVHQSALASTDNGQLIDPTDILSDKGFVGTKHDKGILYIANDAGFVTVMAPQHLQGDLPGMYPLTDGPQFGRKKDLSIFARTTPRPVLDARAEAASVLGLTRLTSGQESKVTGVSVYDQPGSMENFDLPGVRRVRTAVPYDATHPEAAQWKIDLLSKIVEEAGITGTWDYAQPHTGQGTAYLDYTPQDYQRALIEGGVDNETITKVIAHIFAGSDRFKMHDEVMENGHVNNVIYDYGTDSSARFEPDMSQEFNTTPGVVKVFHGTKNSKMGPGDLRGSKRGLYQAGIYLHTVKGFSEKYAGTKDNNLPQHLQNGPSWLDDPGDDLGQVFEYDIDMGTTLDLDAPGGQDTYNRLTWMAGDDEPYSSAVFRAQQAEQGDGLLATGSGMYARHQLLQAGYDSIVADRKAVYKNADGEHVVEDGREYIVLSDQVTNNAAQGNKTSLALVQGRRAMGGQGALIPSPHDVSKLGPASQEIIDFAEEAYAVLQAQRVEPTIQTWGDMPEQWQVRMKDIAQEAEGKRNLWFFPASSEDMKKFALLMEQDIEPYWQKVDPDGAMKMPADTGPLRRWVPEFREWDSRTILVAGRQQGYRVKDLFGESVLDQAFYPVDRAELQHTNIMLKGNSTDAQLHAAVEYRWQDDVGVGGTHVVESAPEGHPHTQPVFVPSDMMPYVTGRTSDAVSGTVGRVIDGKMGEQQIGNSAIVSTQGQKHLDAKYPDKIVTVQRTGESILDQRINLKNPETDKVQVRRPSYAAVYLPPTKGDLPNVPRSGVPQIMFDHDDVVDFFTANGFNEADVSTLDLTFNKSGSVIGVSAEGTTLYGGNLLRDLLIQGGVDMDKTDFTYKVVERVSLK